MADGVDYAAYVDMFVKLRDKKKEVVDKAKKDAALLQDGMDKIEALLKAKLYEDNAESVRTSMGTFFKVLKESVTVANRDTFYPWAKENGQEDLLDIRAAKTNIIAYKEAHGGELPPGLNYSAEVEVQVRRS